MNFLLKYLGECNMPETRDRFMDYLELMGERVVIIKWKAPSSSGLMIVLANFYEKKMNKFKKAFKDAEMTYFCECILTEEILNEVLR